MKRIYFHGELEKHFGDYLDFDVHSPAMMIRACISQLEGFEDIVRPGRFVIIRGPRVGGYSLGVEDMPMHFGNTDEMHLVPVVQGSGGRTGGVIKIVLGVALLAVGIGGAFLAAGDRDWETIY